MQGIRSMRVIAGTARSVPLYEVRAATTRSMTDRVKTSVFSILDPRLIGARVIDIYAGTGGLGIEALSRGATFCTFVDRDRDCAQTIARNLERTRVADRARILNTDAASAVRQIAQEGERADVVIFDPPFPLGTEERRGVLDELADTIARDLLELTGLLVYHHEQGTDGGIAPVSLAMRDQRTYGRNIVTFLVHTDSLEEPPAAR